MLFDPSRSDLHASSIFSSTTQLSRLTMFTALVHLFRRKPRQAQQLHSEDESLDSETLLSVSMPTPATSKQLRGPSFELQVALKTLITCSIVYLSVGLWIVHSIRKTQHVSDADEFCMHHVSQYCRPAEVQN